MRSVATLAVAAGHEINNPLMALIASLELLERTQTPNAYGQARLSVALAAAWEIKEKVRQLGRITRLEQPWGDPICRRCSISKSPAGERVLNRERPDPTLQIRGR
jgi:signal transduction histidine kinase